MYFIILSKLICFLDCYIIKYYGMQELVKKDA